MKRLYFLAVLLFSFPALAEVSNNLVIDNAFARSAIKDQRNSAVFMQITNQGEHAELVSASSDAAKVVELHTHVNDSGVMRMRKIDKIDLPSNQTVVLEPGGLHIMFIGLLRDLNVGESVDVDLGFSDGSHQLISVPIHRVMMKPAMKGHENKKH